MTTGDPFDELAGDPDLGRAAGASREEWRAEEEAYARAAWEQWSHRRSLPDIVRAFMHRGDTLAAEVGHLVSTGTVTDLGEDFFVLQTATGPLDVRFGPRLVLRLVRRARAGGRRGTGRLGTFRARLLEYESDAVDVVVGASEARDELRGHLTVGRDHVAVGDREGCETYVPLDGIAWVRSRPD